MNVNRWFFAETSAEPIRIGKVAFGTIFFLAYAFQFPLIRFIFAFPDTFQGDHFVEWLKLSKSTSYLLYFAVLGSAAAYAFLWRARWPGLILVCLHSFFVLSFPQVFAKWANVFTLPLLYLALVRIGGGAETAKASQWPVRLIQIQTFGIYIYAATNRIGNPLWESGEILLYFLNSNYSRFPAFNWEHFSFALQNLSWLIWLIEFVCPWGLWHRRTRVVCVSALIVMHLSMEVLATLQWWPYLMISTLICFFGLQDGRKVTLWKR